MTVVATERLTLRPFEPGDLDAYAAIRGQPEVARYLSGGSAAAVNGRQIAERGLAMFASDWAERGYGPWAVIDRASGRLLGHLGLRYLVEFGETEVMYALDPSAWGRGIATEGAKTAVAHARTLGLARLIAIAMPANKGSLRVMQKAGFVFERMAVFRGIDVAYHGLDLTAPA